MSTGALTALVVGSTVAVVVAFFLVLWRARRTARQTWVGVVGGIVLAVWAGAAALLAQRGHFRPSAEQRMPPIATHLAVVFVGIALSLILSRSLRSLLTNHKHLISLNVWRVEGLVFLILMANGQMPALWALPAGIGDITVGVTALWVAKGLNGPDGERRAILFNWFGLADLIVAVSLGTMTNPGPLFIFHTNPTSELIVSFPLALVPAFLVPLAIAIHGVLLWQLYGKEWSDSPKAPLPQTT
jgi:hypothetical protein